MACCEHCVTTLGFGPRRRKVLLFLARHPELDDEHDSGELLGRFGGGSVKLAWHPAPKEVRDDAA